MNSADTNQVNSDEMFNDELRPGTNLLRGQYVIERFLNSGGFGMTYLAKDSLNRTVVIKECFPATFCTRSESRVHARSRTHHQEFKAIVRLFVQEARRLSKLSHPNIVGVHQVFEDNETAYMVLDYIDGPDLLDLIEDSRRNIGPEELRNILMKTLDAVAYMHDQNILHRDISPDNIIVDRTGNPILIDFGAAREKASKASRALSALLVVKDGYSPQEFYLAGSAQEPSSDLYALAATVYHVIVGQAPPNSQIRLAAVAANRDDPFVPVSGQNQDYENHFLRAIDKALCLFPKDRLQTATEWMTEIDVDKRRAVALEQARQDKNIDLSISQLVLANRRHFLEDIENEKLRQLREEEARREIEEKAKPFILTQEFAVEPPLEDEWIEEEIIEDEDELEPESELCEPEQQYNQPPEVLEPEGQAPLNYDQDQVLTSRRRANRWWRLKSRPGPQSQIRLWKFGKPEPENFRKAEL